MKNILIAAARVGASLESAKQAARTFPQWAVLASLDDFTEVGGDGTVIAAPGALPAEQADDALERGTGIYCEKLPDRTAIETCPVTDETCYAWRLQNLMIESVLKHPKESTLPV